MANITGSTPKLVSTVVDDATTLLNEPRNIATAVLNGVTFVYVASPSENGIEVLTLDSDGQLTSAGRIADTDAITLENVWNIETFEIGGNAFLAATSANTSGGVTVFSLTDDRPFLTFADQILQSEDPDYNLSSPYGIDVATLANGTYLYGAASSSDGVSVFSVTPSGGLSNVQNLDDSGSLELSGAVDVHVFSKSSVDYLAVSGFDDNGLSIFRINSVSGELSSINDYDGSATGDWDGSWGTASIDLDGTIYLYNTADFGSAVHVLAFDGSTIDAVQSIQSTSLFSGATHAEVITSADRAFVAISSFASSTLTFYEVDTRIGSGTTGQLSLLQIFNDSANVDSIGGASASKAITLDDKTFVIATASLDNAVNVFEVGAGDDLLEGTPDDDTIEGLGGDDIIYALSGDDTVDGGEGTDIIYAGSGLDTVLASDGNDRTYGGSSYDTFDARSFDDSGAGVTIDLFNERFILPDGMRQFLTDFERVYATNDDDLLIGDDDNNDLRGGSGADSLRGREGRDTLRGQNDNDMLYGGDGDDTLLGGYGDDSILNGGDGNDTIQGEQGRDSLFGGTGNDDLDGGSENDILRGNDGEDSLSGGDGDDDARGGDNNDTILGGAGADFLSGDGGNDILNGEENDDTLTGGSGADTFVFKPISQGGGGFNTIKDFSDGEDVLDISYGLDFSEVHALMSQRSWGARIDFADGQVVALEGYQRTDFDISDVILS